jgi:polysaccharide export outer membrane protein
LLNFAFATGVSGADAPLRPGDQITMKLGGITSTEISAVSGTYTIDGDGSVNLPHVGRVKIAGLTPGAAESTIQDVYKSQEIYTNPNVVITMQAQSRFVNVGGEVNEPQRVPFTPDLTILSSINAAGGFSRLADARKVRLLRDNTLMIIDVNKIRSNPSLDLQVQPGDRIEAPSIFQNSKNSPDELQQAKQKADLASNQPAGLEAQLKAQDKLQKAQQNADPASNQRVTLETQLKQAQDRLQQAQQNADLASSQRADLETQLKQAQDKLQLAQQNADLASSQRADLQARLKKAEENLQLAQRTQQNADLLSSQRADLETQLKQAQDKLQLAQQNADAASSQRADLEARLKKAEDRLQRADLATTQPTEATTAKNNENSANQLRSGRTLPPDASENSKSGTWTQSLIQSVDH